MNRLITLEQVMRSKIDQYFIQSRLRQLAVSFVEYKLTETTIFGDLTRLHYEMFGGKSDEIEKAVAAVEMLLLALDIYDDLQDQDNEGVPWSQVNPAEALNVAIGLQALSIAILDDSHFTTTTKLRAIRFMNQAIIRAVNGQHTDLLNYVNEEEDCLHMIRNKSGTLAACACLVGTTLATVQHSDLVAQYGQGIGIIGQIRNDMNGIVQWDARNDLLNRKRTLPILYLLDYDHPLLQIVRDYYSGKATQAEILAIKHQVMDLIHTSGSLQYAQVILKTTEYEVNELIDQLPVGTDWKNKLIEMIG